MKHFASLLSLLALAALSSCASDGSYDPVAAQRTVDTLSTAYDTGRRVYSDYQSGYRNPYVVPVAPVAAPVVPAAPLYRGY